MKRATASPEIGTIPIPAHDLKYYRDCTNAYHRVMGLLRDMQMEHGLCKPRSRMACTACNAKDELDRLLAEYKGPPIIPASFTV